MNNGFENNGQNDFVGGQSGNMGQNGAPYYSGNDMSDNKDDVRENIGNTEDLSKVDPTAPRRADTGEYHYRGNQMGGFGTERFTDRPAGRGENSYANRDGQYTHRGYYSDDNMRAHGYGRAFEDDMYERTQSFETAHAQSKRSRKKNGSRKGISVLIVALVCVGTILLSAAAGFGGALAYNKYVGDNRSGNSGKGGSTVIDRVVESDGTTSTGEKGVYTEVSAAVKDSVVEITTEFQVTGFFQYISEGAGSGVIISEDGYIITNNHVISDTSKGTVADSITVRLTDGTEYKAEVIGKDADSDIAVIKIEAEEKLSHAVFGDSDKLVVGEEVIAVGNPLGELGGTVTNGIISALDRELTIDGQTMRLLQTNAAINPGNSGGGLFNMKGELVAIVNAKSSGTGIEGLGFAIPINYAYEIATELLTNGYVSGRPALGISYIEISNYMDLIRYGVNAYGIYVYDGGETPLQNGDRIISFGDYEVSDSATLKNAIGQFKVGDKVELLVARNGKFTKVFVTLIESKPEETSAPKLEINK